MKAEFLNWDKSPKEVNLNKRSERKKAGHHWQKDAEEMKAKFVHDYQNLMKQLNAEEDAKRRNGEACLLCGCEKLIFEPPVFYCNGLNCPSKRIRRNSYYYVGGNNQFHWC